MAHAFARLARFLVPSSVVILLAACVGPSPDTTNAPDPTPTLRPMADPVENPPFRPTASVEEIMHSIIDPAADAVWDAVVIESNADGVTTTQPETNDDWLMLRRHAITLIEASNLLLVEGRAVADAGSRSELPGIDLEPEEIEELLAADRETWMTLAGGLHDSGVEVLTAVDQLDVDALLTAGDRLDLACEACHSRYWYPGYGEREDEITAASPPDR